MRVGMAALLLAPILSGCIAEPGLSSSPTECPDSEPVADGFLVTINTSLDRFAGHCMELSDRDADVDEAVALRKVPASGQVYLPVDHAAEYYISISVAWKEDRYCADHIGEFRDHPGTGLVELTVDNTPICT